MVKEFLSKGSEAVSSTKTDLIVFTLVSCTIASKLSNSWEEDCILMRPIIYK